MLIVGIDPGEKSGAVAATDGSNLATMPMPNLAGFIAYMKVGSNHVVYLEQLQPLPSQARGGVASFKIGKHYGELIGVLTTLGINFTLVRPQLWQSYLGCSYPGQDVSYTEKKRKNKELAQRLFPKVKVTLQNADAILIAEYGKRIYERTRSTNAHQKSR